MRLLLIHGLGRTPASLALLAARLRTRGYDPRMFAYFAVTEDFGSIVKRLRNSLRDLETEGPYGVITHSLGAVLTRAAIGAGGIHPHHVAMIAPPNRPPRLAKWAVRQRLFTWFSRDSGAKLTDQAFYATLPGLNVPYTIIAGNRGWEIGPFEGEPNDGVVAVSETRIEDEDEVMVVPGTHTFLMNRQDVTDLVVAAIGPPVDAGSLRRGE